MVSVGELLCDRCFVYRIRFQVGDGFICFTFTKKFMRRWPSLTVWLRFRCGRLCLSTERWHKAFFQAWFWGSAKCKDILQVLWHTCLYPCFVLPSFHLTASRPLIDYPQGLLSIQLCDLFSLLDPFRIMAGQPPTLTYPPRNARNKGFTSPPTRNKALLNPYVWGGTLGWEVVQPW